MLYYVVNERPKYERLIERRFFWLSLLLEYNLIESLLPGNDGFGISEKQHLPCQ